MKDLSGKTFGEFRLISHIGSGGMADVYLGEQINLERPAAIKVLRPALMEASGERVVDRFRREAMLAAGLNHPNIVQVYTIGVESGFHFIAQEFVHGNDLASIIKTRRIPELPVALHIVRQVASALAAAGEAEIVHRDIKPDNILVTHRGVVKVADFGLAQLHDSSERGDLTLEGMTLGTPLYMSPEQVRGKELDPRSDIYSLGVTCYQLLCGQTPFSGTTATSIAVQHLTTKPPPLSEENSQLPDTVCRMVHRMMAKRRSQRYQTAAAIGTDVNTLLTAHRQKRSLHLVRLPELLRLEKPRESEAESETAVPDASPTESRPKQMIDSFSVIPLADDLDASDEAMPVVRQETPWISLPSWEEDDENDARHTDRRSEFKAMDLTAMVDVTFLLLIFFMITAAFNLQKNFDVPAAYSEEAALSTVIDTTDSDAVKVEITNDNRAWVGERSGETFDEILDMLTMARSRSHEAELHLRIDPDSIHELRIRVVDAAAQAGFPRIRSIFGEVD